MSVRRVVIYSGLTFSLASLAFSFGSWTAQRNIQQQLDVNDARLTALSQDFARGIERIITAAAMESDKMHQGPR